MMFKSKAIYQKFKEIIPLIIISSLLPMLNGGESTTAKVIFFSFPLLYLLIIFRHKLRSNRSFRIVLLAWIALLFSNFLSTVFSISLGYSVLEFAELLGIFVYFVIFYLTIKNESDLKIFSFSILMVGFFLSIQSLYYIFFPPERLKSMNLVYAVFGHNHLSDYLLFVIPISAFLFIHSKGRSRSLVSGLLLLFFFLSFYLTFARAALAVLSLATLSLIWFYKPTASKSLFLFFLGFLPVIIISSILFLSHSGLEKQLALPNRQDQWLMRQLRKPLDKEGRLQYWQQAVKGFALHPFFGNGPGTFRLTSRRFQEKPNLTSWFAHNNFLQVLSETGILGFVLLLFLLLSLARQIKKPSKKSSYVFPILVGVVASLAQSVVDFNFDFLAIYLLFWLALSAVLKLSHQSNATTYKIPRILIFLVSLICFLFVVSSFISAYFSYRANQAKSVSEKLAYTCRRFSFFLPTFDTQKLDSFPFFNLTSDPALLSCLIESSIFWNKEDANIYQRIASLYPAPEIFEKIILLDPLYSAPYHGRLFQLALDKDDMQSAIDHLGAAAVVLIKHQAAAYPGLIQQPSMSYQLPEGNSQLNKELVGVLRAIPGGYYLEPFSPGLAKVFYRLGLIAFRHSEMKLTENLWQTSVFLAPEWSYFHIELANLYLADGKTEVAKQKLDYCLNFKHPRGHCKNFMDEHITGETYEPVGFLSSTIQNL